MPTHEELLNILNAWGTRVGQHPTIDADPAGRELWRVTSVSGERFYLKRLGPWRNLPLTDEIEILNHLSARGIAVAPYLPTDKRAVYAGAIEDCFVLMPQMRNAPRTWTQTEDIEPAIGAETAQLHLALATWSGELTSFTYNLESAVAGDLMLPDDIATGFQAMRASSGDVLRGLPMQRIHGDLTPENVLVEASVTAVSLIDFDHLPLSSRVWDIGKYLSRRLRRGVAMTEWSDIEGVLASFAPFLVAYQRVNSLSREEGDALPLVICAANVLEVSYFAEISAGILPRRMLADHDQVLADSIAAARWHLQYAEDVTHCVQTALDLSV